MDAHIDVRGMGLAIAASIEIVLSRLQACDTPVAWDPAAIG